ncbi:MAG TPA: glycosyltransferase [Aquella sp.]|nr:glycosyltransferase [Aquella sp.]
MIKVTVIIPSYNHAKFIGEAIQSVLNQTFQDFEILICDDASVDNSTEIIRQYTDSRIMFNVNSQNMGAVYTLNTMIKQARGQYIALLNSDDVWLPEKLEKQVKFLDENQHYAAVFSDAQVIYEDGREYNDETHFYANIFKKANRSRDQWLSHFFKVGNCICHPSMLIRKSVYVEIGLYNRLMASLPDFEMWVRVCAKYNIYIMPEKLVKFRILDGERNASGNNPDNIIRGQFESLKVFDAFCLISDVAIFNLTFPNFPVLSTGQIPMQLAKILLNDARITAKYWAINKIYQLLAMDYNYFSEFITDVEFTRLTAQNDIFNVLHLRNAMVQMYYAVGDKDFNPENYLQQIIKPGINRYEFDISNILDINKLRIDPVNLPAHVQFINAFVVDKHGIEHPLIIKMNNANQTNQNKFSYYHDDPNWFFELAALSGEDKLKKIVVEFRVEPIEAPEIFTYINMLTERLSSSLNELSSAKNILSSVQNELSLIHDELNSTQSKLGSIQNELDSTRNGLSLTQNELGVALSELTFTRQELQINKSELKAVYNSLSWKITKPMRQFGIIVRKLRNRLMGWI